MNYETHIPTQQPSTKKNDRLQGKNENSLRAQYNQQKKAKRAEKTSCLKGKETFPKSHRLRNRKDYSRVKSGKRIVGRYLILNFCLSKSKKIGISASAKFGSSPERNRFKRLVREAFRKNHPHYPLIEMNVIPRSQAKKASGGQIFEELNRLVLNETQ